MRISIRSLPVSSSSCFPPSSAASTRDPPHEQWLAGLGAGAGSFPVVGCIPVVCHRRSPPSLLFSLLFPPSRRSPLAIIPPSPLRYSPPSPSFPLHRRSRACRGCRRGWGWRGVLVVGCSHCLPPVFLPSVVLHVMVVRRWPSLALECWASGSVSLAVPCPSLSSLVGRHPASRGSQRRHRAG